MRIARIRVLLLLLVTLGCAPGTVGEAVEEEKTPQQKLREIGLEIDAAAQRMFWEGKRPTPQEITWFVRKGADKFDAAVQAGDEAAIGDGLRIMQQGVYDLAVMYRIRMSVVPVE